MDPITDEKSYQIQSRSRCGRDLSRMVVGDVGRLSLFEVDYPFGSRRSFGVER